MGDDIVLRLRGLPWSTTEDEIISFFDPIEIAGGTDGVHITMSREGRPSGEAYVELANPDDIAEAEKKHNQHIGRRYVEVFRAKVIEMQHAVKRSQSKDNEDDCCVRLRGLPFGCSKEEILQFFDGLEIVPNGIVLPTDYQGRHTGEAYVQFVDKETAEMAQDKHKEKIAHRYIEIFKSNMAEVYGGLNSRMRGGGGGGGGGGGPYGGPMGGGGGGFNSRPSPYDSRDRFGGQNRYSSMPPSRPRFDDFDSYGGGGGGGGGGGYSDNWGTRSGGGGMRPGRGDRDGGGGGGDGSHCVHMRGLPFKASEMDIADFFRPLNPINICLMKHGGRPSGEADIEFACHDDAVKAMSRDKANMQHRYIELFLNSSSGGGGGGMGGMGRSGGFGGGYRDAPRIGGAGGGGGRYGGSRY